MRIHALVGTTECMLSWANAVVFMETSPHMQMVLEKTHIVCVCERERDKVCVCVCEREGESGGGREREGEGERERNRESEREIKRDR